MRKIVLYAHVIVVYLHATPISATREERTSLKNGQVLFKLYVDGLRMGRALNHSSHLVSVRFVFLKLVGKKDRFGNL